jgi:hypothetical protein
MHVISLLSTSVNIFRNFFSSFLKCHPDLFAKASDKPDIEAGNSEGSVGDSEGGPIKIRKVIGCFRAS